jgi:integrase
LLEAHGVTPQDARHPFASQLASLGFTSTDVKDHLGHSTERTTERIYIHSFGRSEREERIRAALDGLAA